MSLSCSVSQDGGQVAGRGPKIKKPALEERRRWPKQKTGAEQAPDGLKGFFPPRLAARGSLDDYFWMFA
jgi:hypothetical protein